LLFRTVTEHRILYSNEGVQDKGEIEPEVCAVQCQNSRNVTFTLALYTYTYAKNFLHYAASTLNYYTWIGAANVEA